MSLAGKFESLRAVAVGEVDRLHDELLLSKDVRVLAEHVAERHYLEPVCLRRVLIGPPRPVWLCVPGEPGRETSVVSEQATRVDLWLLADGFGTLVRLHEGSEGLDLGEADLNLDEQCLAVSYVAEHPVAEVANEHFQESVVEVQDRVARLNEHVQEFNRSLLAALQEAALAAKARAEERKAFADELRIPHLQERRVTA